MRRNLHATALHQPVQLARFGDLAYLDGVMLLHHGRSSALRPLLTGPALSLLAALAACSGAEADPAPSRRAAEFHSDAVEGELEGASEVVRARGFSDEATPWRGFLVDRSAAVDEALLRSGSCYVVLAATSAGVRSVSLLVHDSDGSEVARSEVGARALHYCPPQSGTYFLAVRTDGSGLFAVRRFVGPTGLDVRLDDLAPPPPEVRTRPRP